jgi:Rha family phage regulatory protein
MNLPEIKTTMSSREIAAMTGKRHADLMRDIRNMEVAWVRVNGCKFALVEYKDAKGEKRPEYLLTKTECLYIATKFNDEARVRLILRWEQLEHQQSNTGNLVAMTEELQRQRQELHDDMKKLESRADKLEIIEEFILESMAKAGYRLDVEKTTDAPTLPQSSLPWQESFILTYEQYVFDNIASNIDDWISQGTIPVAEFNRKYKPKGLGVKMYIRAIKRYCIHCNIRFVPHKVVYLTQAGTVRCRIFEK